MPKLIFSKPAEEDLNNICQYIAMDSLNAAAQFVDFIESKCNLLARNPRLGRVRNDIADTMHSFPIKSYVIFYQPLKDGVEILRILHSARDLESLFE